MNTNTNANAKELPILRIARLLRGSGQSISVAPQLGHGSDLAHQASATLQTLAFKPLPAPPERRSLQQLLSQASHQAQSFTRKGAR